MCQPVALCSQRAEILIKISEHPLCLPVSFGSGELPLVLGRHWLALE